ILVTIPVLVLEGVLQIENCAGRRRAGETLNPRILNVILSTFNGVKVGSAIIAPCLSRDAEGQTQASLIGGFVFSFALLEIGVYRLHQRAFGFICLLMC